MNFSTDFTLLYLLTNAFTQADSRTAKARDLISSLINVASSRDVPFHQLQLLQCMHHGATLKFAPLCAPHSFCKVTICS